MQALSALIRKELRLYFNSPIAYIFIVVFISFSMWMFFRGFFLTNQADLRGYFDFLPWIFLFLIPANTMRMWAEEYRQGTVETLLTSSLPIHFAVLGKFLASLAFLGLALLLTFLLPISISFIGNLDWGVILVAYLGVFLLGAAYTALGLFISSITNNQIVAFILAVIVTFAFYILGSSIVTFALPGFITGILQAISLGNHYDSIIRGVVDTRDIIYYLSFIGFFLLLNYYVLKSRR
ncbi:MAG: ABC transporter permease [Candidatus Gracilibacteria bacterium]|jgi:ABC-2 type transport system permease protein|nr:ABC transporter permease [Candidatus Gracilibacteria bacterium]MDD5179624.1 ABC transporter permease [Candidatus Gracilibacteria bacterium]